MKVYETKDNWYNEHNSGGLKTGQPTVSTKKRVMKDGVSSPDTKNVCLPPDDTKKEGGAPKKWGRGGRYNIYVHAVIVRDQS